MGLGGLIREKETEMTDTAGTPETKSFLTPEGREVILRPPQDGDAPALLEYINAVVAEDTYVLNTEPYTLEQEEDWLRNTLEQIRKGDAVHVSAWVEGRCVGTTAIFRKPYRSRHVGEFGIIVARDYRHLGLGRLLMEEIHRQAEASLALRLTQLMCLATNTRALRMYRNFGYIACGTVPEYFLHRGEYVDRVCMFRMMKTGEAPK